MTVPLPSWSSAFAPPSWPGVAQPSTSFCAHSPEVNSQTAPGHDEESAAAP